LRHEFGDGVGGQFYQGEVGFAALVGLAAALFPLLDSAAVESEALGEAGAGQLGHGANLADIDRFMHDEARALAAAKRLDLAEP